MYKFSYEHNVEHNRSKIRGLHPRLIDKIYLCTYANLVIKNNKIIYRLWHNCSSHEHNIEYNRQFLALLKSIIGKNLSIMGWGIL